MSSAGNRTRRKAGGASPRGAKQEGEKNPAASQKGTASRGPAGPLFTLLLLLLSVAIYWPALDGPFVLDDYDFVEAASAVRMGGPRALIGSGRPVLMLSFVLNHRLAGGFDPLQFHITNLLLHYLAALVLWRLAAALFASGRLGGIEEGAGKLLTYGLPLLFLTSPIQTESVAYVSSRSEVLSTLFYLLGLWAFVRWRERHRWFAAAAVMLCFCGAALSKQDKLTLAAAVAALDYLLLSGCDWRKLRHSWPTYGLFAAGSVAGFFIVVKPFLYAPSAGFMLDWRAYLFTQFRMYFRYLGQLIYPFNLNLDPDITVSHSLMDELSWLALILLLAIAGAAIYFHRRAPLPVFGATLFFLALAPSSSFYPLLDYAAERRLYLPSIGFFIVLLWGLSKLFEPGSKAPRWTVAALALIYCGGTYARSQVWSDEYAIWADTVAKSPRKERPLTWLGRVAFQRGLNDEALRHWTEAEKLTEPGSDQQVYLLVNIGLAHARAKNYEEAIRAYRKALDIKDNDGRIWAQLAVAQIRAGFKDEGWESFGTAFKHQRRMGPEVLTLAAQELFVDGRYREAAKFYADALEYRPDDMEVRRNLEIALQRAAQAGQ